MKYRFAIIKENRDLTWDALVSSYGFAIEDTFVVLKDPRHSDQYFVPLHRWCRQEDFLKEAHEHLKNTSYESEFNAYVLGAK